MFVLPKTVGPYELTPLHLPRQETAYLCFDPDEGYAAREILERFPPKFAAFSSELGVPFYYLNEEALSAARHACGKVGDATDVESWLAAWAFNLDREYLPRLSAPLPSFAEISSRFGEVERYIENVSKRMDLTGFIYCGRKWNRDGWRKFLPSKWANRFPVDVDTTEARLESVERFYNWLRRTPPLLLSLHELRGASLGCWCKPKLCHTMPLAVLANFYLDYSNIPDDE